MAERKRIVTINPYDGTVSTLKDLDDGSAFASVRGSFQVKQGQRRQSLAQRSRRYAGAEIASESHENDTVTWKALVKGSTSDAVLQNAEAMLLVTERATYDTLVEWRPEGASASSYYAIQGPAQFELTYEWGQFAGSQSMYVDVTIPVEPLVRGTLATQTISSSTFPGVVQLGSAVGGNADALADVALRFSGGSAAPVWALVGWSKRPGTPLSSSVAPFGIIEAESGTNLSTWAGVVDANYRPGTGTSGIRATTSGAGTASATWAVDPSVMEPDEFTPGTVDIEVWARLELAYSLVSPKLTLSLEPFAGTSFGQPVYTPEYGSAGKLLTVPSASNTKFRPVRLGTLTMPVDPVQPLKWYVKLAASWAAGSSGSFGVDYLVMVPARQRACSRSGVANDSTFPKFIASTSDTNKLIRSDLSGWVASGTGNFGPDSGLGGSPIELPAGNVDLVVWPSSVVPDDPTVDASGMQISHTGVTGKVYITPRYFLARA